MKEIRLTNRDFFVLVDDEDYELLNQYKWRAGGYKGNYVVTGGVYNTVMMHRMIMNAPKDKIVDHKDGNGLNNQRSNLRLCSQKQNSRNRTKRRGTSKFLGVYWDKERCKWYASIYINGKGKNLGLFSKEEDAAKAYDKAAIENFGEYANLNFSPAQGELAA